MKSFTLKELAAEVKREIALRLKDYPVLVREKKMTEAQATLAVAKMDRIREILEEMDKKDNGYFNQTIEGNI